MWRWSSRAAEPGSLGIWVGACWPCLEAPDPFLILTVVRADPFWGYSWQSGTWVPFAFKVPYGAHSDGSASVQGKLPYLRPALAAVKMPLYFRAAGHWKAGRDSPEPFLSPPGWRNHGAMQRPGHVVSSESWSLAVRGAVLRGSAMHKGEWIMWNARLKTFHLLAPGASWKKKPRPLGLKGCVTAGHYKAVASCSLEMKFYTKATCITSLPGCFLELLHLRKLL